MLYYRGKNKFIADDAATCNRKYYSFKTFRFPWKYSLKYLLEKKPLKSGASSCLSYNASVTIQVASWIHFWIEYKNKHSRKFLKYNSFIPFNKLFIYQHLLWSFILWILSSDSSSHFFQSGVFCSHNYKHIYEMPKVWRYTRILLPLIGHFYSSMSFPGLWLSLPFSSPSSTALK